MGRRAKCASCEEKITLGPTTRPEGQAQCRKCRFGDLQFHTLSNINAESMTANCGKCGAVPIRKKNLRNGTSCYVCSGARRDLTQTFANFRVTFRDYLIGQQGGRCAICRVELKPGQQAAGAGTSHVDHDHVTKKIRGVLCHECNLGLGHFGDSPVKLRAAAEYLERVGGPLPEAFTMGEFLAASRATHERLARVIATGEAARS